MHDKCEKHDIKLKDVLELGSRCPACISEEKREKAWECLDKLKPIIRSALREDVRHWSNTEVNTYINKYIHKERGDVEDYCSSRDLCVAAINSCPPSLRQMFVDSLRKFMTTRWDTDLIFLSPRVWAEALLEAYLKNWEEIKSER